MKADVVVCTNVDAFFFVSGCSNTFQNVHVKSETLWRYYLYDLIYEYFDKPILPPPLIIFSHLYTVWQSCTCTGKSVPDSWDNAFCKY